MRNFRRDTTFSDDPSSHDTSEVMGRPKSRKLKPMPKKTTNRYRDVDSLISDFGNPEKGVDLIKEEY